jgi:hypothetical protein
LTHLKLVDTTRFNSGIVVMRYAPQAEPGHDPE